eukprot:UN17507
MQKHVFYQSLVKQTESLIGGESNIIANMANISALLLPLRRCELGGLYLWIT